MQQFTPQLYQNQNLQTNNVAQLHTNTHYIWQQSATLATQINIILNTTIS
jgi:hypothetical protein